MKEMVAIIPITQFAVNLRHFIVQLMHTNYKILRLLK